MINEKNIKTLNDIIKNLIKVYKKKIMTYITLKLITVIKSAIA